MAENKDSEAASTADQNAEVDDLQVVHTLESPILSDEPRAQARSGVRRWIRQVGRRGLDGGRRVAPWSLVAVLAGAALSPVLNPAAGVSEFQLVLNQLAGLSGNFLPDVLARAARGLPNDPSPQEWADAIAESLTEQLNGDSAQVGELRDDVVKILAALDAVGSALAESTEHSAVLGREMTAAFGELEGVLREEAAHTLRRIQEELAIRSVEQRQQTEMTHGMLQEVTASYSELVKALTRGPEGPAILATSVPQHRDDRCPYPGLTSFGPRDAEFFVGRTSVVEHVLAQVAELVHRPPGPLVVLGASGAGKTSLLQAAVVPAVARGDAGGGDWTCLTLTPTSKPLTELAGRTAALAGVSALDSLERLQARPEDFGALAAQAAGSQGRLLIVVDQFEELFTAGAGESERLAFATALVHAAPAVVLIAVRADFYAQCASLAPLVRYWGDRQIVLGPLPVDELRQVILQPAARVGLEVEPGLLELMLADLGAGPDGRYEPGVLPLLAQALRATWVRRRNRTLTVDGYREGGGIRGAVATEAERVYRGLTAHGQDELRRLLLRSVVVTGEKVTRRPVPLLGLPTQALGSMVAARLMTVDQDTAQISHEALLTAWPRLAAWVEGERENLRLRRRLEDAARSWEDAGKDPGGLYRGAYLAAVKDWSQGQDDLGPLEREFVERSLAAAESELQNERRRVGRLRRLSAALVVLLTISLVAGGAFVAATRTAKARTARAESIAAASESSLLLGTDSRRGMLLAAQAWKRDPEPERARSALLAAPMSEHAGLLETKGFQNAVALSPDAQLTATGGKDGHVQLWDNITHDPVADLGNLGGQVAGVQFSPDGTMLAAGTWATYKDQTTNQDQATPIKVWAIPSARLMRSLPGTFGSPAWTPDNRLLSATTQDLGRVGEWDVRTGRQVGVIGPRKDPSAFRVAVNQAGDRLAVVRLDGSVDLLRFPEGRLVSRVLSPGTAPGRLAVAAFSPDGTLAVSDSTSGQITFWDDRNGAARGGTPPGSVYYSTIGLKYTPDGLRLYAIGGNSAPRSWDVLNHNWIGDIPLGETDVDGSGVLGALDVAGTGHLVAVAGGRSTVLVNRTQNWLRGGATGAFGAAVPSPQGDQLLAGSTDGSLWQFDLKKQSYQQLSDGLGVIQSVAWASENTVLATTGTNRILVMATTGRHRQYLSLAAGQVATSIAYVPKADLIVAVAGIDPNHLTKPVPSPDRVDIWDGRTLERVISWAPGKGSSDSIDVSPDGRTLAVVDSAVDGDTSTLLTYDIERLRGGDTAPTNRMDLNSGIAVAVRFSPDRQTIAVAEGGKIVLRDATTLRQKASFGTSPGMLRYLQFSPDGRTIASISENQADPLIRLWKVADGSLQASLVGHTGPINKIAFSPDGRTLFSAGVDGTIGKWALNPDDAMSQVCQRLSGSFLDRDWRSLGIASDRVPCRG